MKLARLAALVALAAALGGCTNAILPENVGVEPALNRTPVADTAEATLATENGMPDALWLEADRITEPGRVGGYLSDPPGPRASLVVVLAGASTFNPNGPVGVAQYTHMSLARPLRDAGYRTLTLVRRECSSAYGQEDLTDLLEMLDWLDREGRAWLGVERVYTYGYSTGGTLATLANRRRTITAVVSIGGLTQPDQFYELRPFYRSIAAIFPNNTGLCHLGTTLREYGPSHSPGWETLNTVDHLDELRRPELFVQGGLDIIHSPDNLLNLRHRYEQEIAAGAQLTPLEFLFLPDLDHFETVESPRVMARVLEFYGRFEPEP